MKIFILCQYVWNGSVLISTDLSAYSSKVVAEKVMTHLKERNEEMNKQRNIELNTTFEIKECPFFERESEVPCLN